MREITYQQLAAELRVSPRQARTLVASHKGIIQPIIYSYKNRRFALNQVRRLKAKLKKEAVQRGRTCKTFVPIEQEEKGNS